MEKLILENKALKEKVNKLNDKIFKIEMDKQIREESKNYMESMQLSCLEKQFKKTSEKCNIYKKTINKMCDKFGIKHEKVFEIIDEIKNDKQSNNSKDTQRER